MSASLRHGLPQPVWMVQRTTVHTVLPVETSLLLTTIHSMEAYQPDIQALLQDINGNYRNAEHKILPPPLRPAAQSMLKSYEFHTERSTAPRNASAALCEEQTLYDAQASRPLGPYSYSALNDTDLDSHGGCLKVTNGQKNPKANCCLERAFPDEPRHHSPSMVYNSIEMLPTRKPYLSSHTAPRSPVNVSKRQKLRGGTSSGVLSVLVTDDL